LAVVAVGIMAKPKEDFFVKETLPNINATKDIMGPARASDMTEQMHFLIYLVHSTNFLRKSSDRNFLRKSKRR
jgi:hypothetical protein